MPDVCRRVFQLPFRADGHLYAGVHDGITKDGSGLPAVIATLIDHSRRRAEQSVRRAILYSWLFLVWRYGTEQALSPTSPLGSCRAFTHGKRLPLDCPQVPQG